MKVVPPSPPTRVGSTRTWVAPGGPAATAGAASGSPVAPSGVDADDELDLDAVADDAGQRLADQRAVAGLQPVLGESIRDRDPEALLIDVDELGVAQPRLEVGRGERDLQLSQSRSPDLLCIHSSIGSCDVVGRLMGSLDHGRESMPGVARLTLSSPSWHRSITFPRILIGASGCSHERLRRRGPGEDSTARRPAARRFCHTPGEYRSVARRTASGPPRAGARSVVARGLTLFSGPAYHPPDDDAPCAFGRQARLRAFRG